MNKKNMKPLNHLILAEGEVTGHAHRASAGKLYEMEGGLMLLDPGPDGATVTHEEHHATPVITTPMITRRVQEFNHAEQDARNVAD